MCASGAASPAPPSHSDRSIPSLSSDQVIENIYAPSKVVLSPALEHLRSPVKSRLQELTGCECVDISKVNC